MRMGLIRWSTQGPAFRQTFHCMQRRSKVMCLALGCAGLMLALGCPDRQVAMGGQSGDEGTNADGPPVDMGMDDDGPSPPVGGEIELPRCSRNEAYGPEGPSRYYVCFSDDARYTEGEVRWNYGDPTPPGAYRCDCNQEQGSVTDADDCEAALESACAVDLDAPLWCGLPYGACWPLENDPGGWRCRCSEGAPLVEARADRCELAAFTTCNGGACSDSSGSCTPRTDGVGHDCECTNGERIAWPGVWDCQAALSTCKPTCTSGSAGCALRDGGYSCRCTDENAGESAGRVAPPAGTGGPDAGSADAGSVETGATFVPDSDSYGVCRRALELSCGPPPAGETCSEEDEGGRFSCSSDGAGAWDCDCGGRATHVVHQCPLPPGEIAGSYGRLGGLPQPRDPAEIPDEIDTRLYTCIDAVFNCGCE